MCGIVGIHYFGKNQVVHDKTLVEMSNAIAHRGPDDSGQKVFGSFGMGMRRLSVIDLKTGHQPMSNADGSIWVVFNGEIYNFHKIRQK